MRARVGERVEVKVRVRVAAAVRAVLSAGQLSNTVTPGSHAVGTAALLG